MVHAGLEVKDLERDGEGDGEVECTCLLLLGGFGRCHGILSLGD